MFHTKKSSHKALNHYLIIDFPIDTTIVDLKLEEL